jgi:nitric oxide reductase large subunit
MMFRSQQLAFKYFAAAVTLFGIMVVAGLLSATYYLQDGFLLNKLDFSVAKTAHRHHDHLAAHGFHRCRVLVPADRARA